MSIKADIRFFQGEDYTLEVTVIDAAGDAVDITAYTFTCTILADYGDAGAAAGPYTIGSGITIIDGPTGRVDVAIPDADTTGLAAGSYVYDVKRTNDGAESILAHGSLTLVAAATL